MSMFRVTPTQLKAEADKLSELNQQFRNEVEALTEKETALSNMWEGQARDAFHNAYATDKAQFDNFYKGINEFVLRLTEAANDYDRADTTGAGIANTRKA